MREALLRGLAGRAERVLELQRGMTSFPAFSPRYNGVGEWGKAEWLEKRLRAFGVTRIERVDADDPAVPSGKRPNIVARIPGKTARTVWILAHLDVVPPGDLSLWRTDPWVLGLDPDDPDMMRGRGVEDNQQAVAAGVLIAAELAERDIVPDLGFGLMLVADEETGNEKGLAHVLERRPDLIARDDLVVVPDFGTQDGSLIEVAEKGSIWLRITVTGRQCHASTPDEGINSLVAAAAMILRIRETEKRFALEDPLFSPPRTTLVPTRHDANVPNANTMPGKDVFYVDGRILPVYANDDVIAAVRGLGAEIAAQYGVRVDVDIDHSTPAVPPTPPDSEVVVRLGDAVRRVYGLDTRAGGVGGGTVARLVRRMGVPAAVWARVIPNYHAPNEGSRVSHNVGDARVYAHLLFS
jgi:succinyl-diaminopimelate desuccinylase